MGVWGGRELRELRSNVAIRIHQWVAKFTFDTHHNMRFYEGQYVEDFGGLSFLLIYSAILIQNDGFRMFLQSVYRYFILTIWK